MCFLIDCDAAQSLLAKIKKRLKKKIAIEMKRGWNRKRGRVYVMSPFHTACGRGKNRETDERTNRRTDEQTNRQTWHTCLYTCSVAAWQLAVRRSRMRYRNATKLNFMNPDVVKKTPQLQHTQELCLSVTFGMSEVFEITEKRSRYLLLMAFIGEAIRVKSVKVLELRRRGCSKIGRRWMQGSSREVAAFVFYAQSSR